MEHRVLRITSKTATTKTAINQTETAALKIQIGHKPKRLHDMVTRTANVAEHFGVVTMCSTTKFTVPIYVVFDV